MTSPVGSALARRRGTAGAAHVAPADPPRPLLPTATQLRRAVDATGVLSLFVVLLFALPSRGGVPGLGAAGRPAFLLAGGALVWWAVSRAIVPFATRGRQPLRFVLLGSFLAIACAYAAGAARALPGNEQRSADRVLLANVALAGVALLAMDGIRDRDRLQALLRRIGYLGVLVAAVGSLQFLFEIDLNPKLLLPPLVLNADLLEAGTRPGTDLLRVTGTTAHYIEFGVVLTMIMPVTMHLALFAHRRGRRLAWWASTLFIAGASTFSLSRSGTIGLVLVMVVVVLSWRPRYQWRAAVVGVLALAVFRALVPGLLGTLKGLVTNFGQDSSVDARTLDYARVADYVAERPLFGRGAGTFLPENYFFLDNQFLLTTLEGGLVGLGGLLLLFAGSYAVGRSVRFGPGDEETRHLGQALCASVAIGFVVCATFDAMSFLSFAGLLYLLVGVLGALWRLQREPGPGRVLPAPLLHARSRRSRVLPDA